MSSSGFGKKLMKGTGIYAVGTFGTKILMFLMAPLYTYYLIPSEMGTYDVLLTTIGWIMPIISLQISDAVYRWIIRENVDCSVYLRVTYQFLILSSLLTAAVILHVNHFIIRIPYLLYFLGALFSSMFFQISQKILRGLKRQWLFAVSGIIYTCIFLFLNVFLLCILHRGVEGLFVSFIVANLAGFVLIFVLEKRIRIHIISRFDSKVLRELLGFSVPLIPNYLSWWIIDSSDRYIVLWILGVSANGVLAIAHKFPTVLQSVFGLFLNAWQDMAISGGKDEEEFFTYVFQKLYRLLFMFLWVLIPATKIFVWLVMGKNYKIASDYIPFYYLGAVFQAFCSFYGVGYLRAKNTKGAFSSSIFSAVINAAINIGTIKLIGLHAAAVSTFISFLGMWMIREKQNRLELGIIVSWKEFWLLLETDLLICIFSILGNIWFNLIFLILGTISFLIVNRKDFITILNTLKKKRDKKQ